MKVDAALGRLKVGAKLLLLLGVPLVLNTAGLLLFVSGDHQMHRVLGDAVDWSRHARSVGAIEVHAARALAAVQSAVLGRQPAQITRATEELAWLTDSAERAADFAESFSEDEQEDAAHLSVLVHRLAELSARAMETGELSDLERARGLHDAELVPALAHIYQQESEGSEEATARSEQMEQRLVVRALAIAGAAILLELVLCWLLARHLLGAIARLLQAAQRMATGALDLEVPVGGSDELGHLAQAFNHMARSLRATMISQAQMEQQVHARTAELERTARDLTAAREAALGALRQKSDFLANMSHEIRTPMNGVLGMLSFLLESELDADQRQLASTAQRSGQALLEILNDVLDYSKLEAGKLALIEEPFDLEEVIYDVADLMQGRAAEKGLTLSVRYPPELPRRVLGDLGRLRQVLLNLVGNAVKFTEVGRVQVEVSGRMEGGRAAYTLRVEDTGIGVPEDRKGLLFRPFSQADNSTTRRYGGTGLGLAIARALVERMGGTIAMQSTAGVGSVLSVELAWPIDQRHQPPPARPLSGETVLLLAPPSPMREALVEQLAAFGAGVCGPESAPVVATAALVDGEAPPGWVAGQLTPDASAGDEERHVLAHLQRMARPPRCLVVCRIGSARSRAWSAAGAQDILHQPVRSSRLLQAVQPAPRAEAPRPAPPERRALVALVAEDNAVNLMVASRFLEQLGCRVESAADGVEAVRMVQSKHYDIVFMDCQMPEMDGYEAATRIRALAAPARAVPIVALTAHALRGDREHCLAAGMNDHLAKPVRRAELAAMLERWVPATELAAGGAK